MYERKSRLKPAQRRELLLLFVGGATARAAAEITGVNRNTSADFFMRLRKLIASKQPDFVVGPEFVADDLYLRDSVNKRTGRPVVVKRSPVFGLFRRDGRIHTALVPALWERVADRGDAEPVHPAGMVFTLVRKGSSSTFDMTHFFYANAADGCAGRTADIVNFWSQAKRHLYRFNGIQRDAFHLFLKECEWRFQQEDHGKLMEQLEGWIARSKT